jgi:hypothetical protein
VHRLPDIAPRASPRATRTHSTRHAGRVSHRSHRAPCQTRQRLRPTTHSEHEIVPGASTSQTSRLASACALHARTPLVTPDESLIAPTEPLAKHNSASVQQHTAATRTCRVHRLPDIAPRASPRATRTHSTRHAGRVSHRSHRAPCQTQQRLRPTTHSGHENVPGASTARHSASRQPACYTHALHSSRRTSLSSLPTEPLAKHDSASVQRRTANTRSCRVRRLPRHRASRQPARYTRALHSSRRTSLSSLPQSPLPNTTAPPSNNTQRPRERAGCIDCQT